MASIAATVKKNGNELTGFIREVVRSLWPQTAAEIRLVADQLAMARQASLANMLFTPAASVLIALAQLGRVAPGWLIAWPLVVTVSCVGSEFYYRHLLKTDDGSAAGVSRRARAHARLTLLQSVLWCGMGYAMWPAGNAEAQGFLILIIACSLSGWSSMGTYHLGTAVAGMPAYLVALLVMPLMMGSDKSMLYAALSAGFWLLMRTMMLSNYRTREKMILLEHERSDLIDKLKSAKDESDGARLRAETASRAKSDFLANMSHELRTPLNAILGFSEIIHTKAMGNGAMEQYSEYGGYIHSSGGHLLSLINDILDLAKIEAGRLNLRESEVDLRLLMDEAQRMLETRAAAGGITLTSEIDRDFPNVQADERAMRQMVVNLASNAIKFTPPGGRVTAFANVLEDGSLSFGIDDTGIGIAPEEHAKVFESFGQGRHDAVLADKGTGLGLPIVKGLAESHGGRVILNSVPNEGTRITVIMPGWRARARLKAAS